MLANKVFMLNFLFRVIMHTFIRELKEPIIRILYIYKLIAIAKYWYLNKNERRISKKSTVSFNRRLSVAKKLEIIKYAEERGNQAASNYMESQDLQ